MKIGLILPQFGLQAIKDNVIRLAMMAEQEQFDSLWVIERLLWPSRKRHIPERLMGGY
jgi:alkanesulfonate monooxygenase SsuD/methylene tetrahydromethanopterin reductase-like flavin-dependent oxidoreductase (luciferase family)